MSNSRTRKPKPESEVLNQDPAPQAEETQVAKAPEATVTSLEPRNKVVGRPTVRQDVGGTKVGGGTKVTKPTFGKVTSTFF